MLNLAKPLIGPMSRDHKSYDLFVCALGYEARSRYIASCCGIQSKYRVALGFPDQQLFSYETNLEKLKRLGFEVDIVSDNDFPRSFYQFLTAAMPKDRPYIRVCVDISSFSRTRLAHIVDGFQRFQHFSDVDFLYVLAKYSDPPKKIFANTHVGPVTPRFAGWWTMPEWPLAAIVGLGYEHNKALGAVEHLQVAEIWTFKPHSPEEAYTPALDLANRTLLASVPPDRRVIYEVSEPMTLVSKLESLTFGLSREANVVLLPFGPKIFAISSLLIAAARINLAVWRVSGAEEAVDREPSDFVYGLNSRFAVSDHGEHALNDSVLSSAST